jgi:hypothetical protein
MASQTWQVGASSDDCFRYVGSGYDSINLAYGSETVGEGFWGEPGIRGKSGMRFQNVTIPKGATIDTAYFQIYSENQQSGSGTNTIIKGEDVDDAAAFSTKENYDARSRTSASVDWDITATWSESTWQDSPEIKTVIQEIVNRGGWSSGNDLVIFWEDDGTSTEYREGAAYDFYIGSEYAPKLYIEWTTGGALSIPVAMHHYGHHIGKIIRG